MPAISRTVASMSLVPILLLAYSLFAEPPAQRQVPQIKLPTKTQVSTAQTPANPQVPKQVAWDQVLRLKILAIAPVEKTEAANLLRLKVQRFYGKINQHSWDLAKQHETQEFTILFPAAPDAKINVGDFIDYRIDRYLSASE
jgi:hypothetical protein